MIISLFHCFNLHSQIDSTNWSTFADDVDFRTIAIWRKSPFSQLIIRIFEGGSKTKFVFEKQWKKRNNKFYVHERKPPL